MTIKTLFLNNKFAYALLAFLILNILAIINAPLVNNNCKGGIITYELAKELATSKTILNSWNDQTKMSVAIGLGFDYLFLLVYASFISLLIFRINEKLWKSRPMYKIGKVLIYLTFVAALFDMIENFALVKLLLGDLKQTWSSVAYYFATSKFVILIVSIAYILLSWIALLLRKV